MKDFFLKLTILLTAFGLLQGPLMPLQTVYASESSGSKKRVQEEKEVANRLKLNKKAKTNWVANLLVLAVALGVGGALAFCRKKPSGWIFIGAGVYLISSELMNVLRHKKNVDIVKNEYEGESRDKQIIVLERAAQGAERSAEAAAAREKNFRIAALGFSAAAGMALTEAVLGTPGTAGPGVYPPCLWPQTPPCTKGACGIEGSGFEMPDGYTHNKLKKDIESFLLPASMAVVGRISDLKIPSTPSAVGTPGSASSWGTTTFQGVKKFFGKASQALKKAIVSGYSRSAVFGGFAAATFLAASKVGSSAGDLREQARGHRRLAKKMRRRMEKRQGMGDSPSLVTLEQPMPKGGEGRIIGSNRSKSACVRKGSPGSYPRLDPECVCLKNNSCRKSALPKIDTGRFSNVGGGAMIEATKILGKSANGLYRGNYNSSAKIADSTLKKAATGLARQRKKLVSLANKQAKKQGSKGRLNIEKLEKRAMASLNRAIKQDMARLSPSQKKSLAMAFPARLNNRRDDEKFSEKKGDMGNMAQKETAGLLIGGKKGLGKGRNSGKNGGFGMLFEDKAFSEENLESNEESVDEAGEEDEGQLHVNNINSDPGIPIWETISHRYRKYYIAGRE